MPAEQIVNCDDAMIMQDGRGNRNRNGNEGKGPRRRMESGG